MSLNETEGHRLTVTQQIQLDTLSKVAEICDKHNLQYYIVAGTLLGAIRHGGFIPWDDDIDIAMYREDYEVFSELAQHELGSDYFVQTWRSDRNYTRYITKIRREGTYYPKSHQTHIDMHHGVYIDVFPLDRISSRSGLTLEVRDFCMRFLYFLALVKSGAKMSRRRPQLLARFIKPISLLVPRNTIWAMMDFVCTMSNKKHTRLTTSFASGYGWKKQTVTNETYGEGVKLSFEGRLFNAPKNWKLLLTQLYGDYMIPVKNNKKR